MASQESYPINKESFAVVMLKDGVADHMAKPEDFKRVAVEAESPVHAMMSKEVETEKGYHPIMAAKPGVQTEPEIQATRRSLEGPPTCRSCLNSPCACTGAR